MKPLWHNNYRRNEVDIVSVIKYSKERVILSKQITPERGLILFRYGFNGALELYYFSSFFTVFNDTLYDPFLI